MPDDDSPRPAPVLRAPTTGYGAPRRLNPSGGANRARRTVLVACVACAAVLLAGVLSIFLLNRFVYSPEGVARGYLDAVAAGNAGKALNILSPGTAGEEDTNTAALSDDVLDGAPELPEDIRLDSSHRSADGTVHTDFGYRLGGSRHTASFTLRREDRLWGLFDTWRMTDTRLPTVDVEVAGATTVEINGAEVPVSGRRGQFALIYPARYSIGYQGEYVAAKPVRVDVTDPAKTHAPVRLEPAPTKALTAEVTRQIRVSLDACAKATVLAPPNCPFQAENINRIDKPVAWKIEEYPAIELRPDGDGWALEPARGAAEVTGSQIDLKTAKAGGFRTDVPFEYSADVTVSGKTVTVVPTFP